MVIQLGALLGCQNCQIGERVPRMILMNESSKIHSAASCKPAQPRAAAEPFKKSEVGSSLNLKKIKIPTAALIKKIIKTKYLAAAAAEEECMYKYYSTAAHYQIQIIMGAVLVGSSSIRVGPI